tara:strand:+ start:11505 stop:12902 length:1398 start_codon:yes stop_codon:yes gene_type:complete
LINIEWKELLITAGLDEKEADIVCMLNQTQNRKASYLAKELQLSRLDAYNTLSKLQEKGIVSATADRPMKFSSKTVHEAANYLMSLKEKQILMIKNGLKDLNSKTSSKSKDSIVTDKNTSMGPKFGVIKGRNHIYSKIQEMIDSAQEKIFLSLGSFGILHLTKSSAIDSLNVASKKGIVCEVVACLDKRTLKFYNELDKTISLKHSDNLSSQLCLQDDESVLQFLDVESNPVGKGRNDAALFLESKHFAMSQLDFTEKLWNESIKFETAIKRFTEDFIADPLKLVIGEGSFLQQISSALNLGELPSSDTPFSLDNLQSVGNTISEARNKLSDGSVSNLRLLGINLNLMFRQIGNRIGEELSFSLNKIENDFEFITEVMDWWEYAGLGVLNYDISPNFRIVANLDKDSNSDSEKFPIWELDDGILEGSLIQRFSVEDQSTIKRTLVNQDNENKVIYEILQLNSQFD